MTLYDIVYKIIGPIAPIGETHTDSKRQENLNRLIHLIDLLVTDMLDVAENQHRPEASIKSIGIRAQKYIDQLFNDIAEKQSLDNNSTKQLSDAQRLEWVLKTRATVSQGERMKTRAGGFKKNNLEIVYQCEWFDENENLIKQSVDAGYKTKKAAIDAAIQYDNNMPRYGQNTN